MQQWNYFPKPKIPLQNSICEGIVSLRLSFLGEYTAIALPSHTDAWAGNAYPPKKQQQQNTKKHNNKTKQQQQQQQQKRKKKEDWTAPYTHDQAFTSVAELS